MTTFEEAIRKQAGSGFCVLSEENSLECLSTTMVEYKETRLFGGNSVIIGFGFGNPLQSIIMLLFTSLISYVIYRSLRNVGRGKQNPLLTREQRKQDYYAQRQRAREYARQFDLTDEEIERRLDEEDRI